MLRSLLGASGRDGGFTSAMERGADSERGQLQHPRIATGGMSSFAKRNKGSTPTAFLEQIAGRETGEMLSGPPAAVELTQLHRGHVV